jgi:alpha-tubulin suppressor-like RCC1 family protein
MGATTDRRWRLASVRARLVVLFALAALAGAGIWATQASSAGPSAGQLYAFGANESGQLGPGRPMNDPNAAAVTGFPAAAGAITSASAGGSHTLAVAASGTLYAFGDNTEWQLGNEQTSRPTPTPVTLPGASGGVVQASAGLQFSFALTSSGQLYGFGGNFYGQLGTATNDASTTPLDPEQVPFPVTPGRFAQVATGSYHTLALGSDDKLYAWGNNSSGQVGNLTNQGNTNPNPTPKEVFFPSGHTGTFTQIAGGATDSLALTSTGEVFSWGDDTSGQLGRSTTPANTSDATPGLVTVPGLAGQITSVAAGGSHTLLLSSTGQVYAFGDDRSGQLGPKGNGTAINETPVPVSLPANSGTPVQIAAGSDFSFVLTSTGSVYAFGDNQDGQLGSTLNNGTTSPNPTPAPVAIPDAVNLDAVASGSSARHAVAISADLSVTSTALPPATTGAAYSAQAAASGGTTPYMWAAANLPPGLSISSSGAITGTPTTAGQFTPTLTVTDSSGISASVRSALAVRTPTTSTATTAASTTTTTTTASTSTSTTTAHPPRVSVPSVAIAGPVATLTAKCAGGAGQACSGAITGTTIEHFVGGKLVSVTAAAAKPKPKKTKTKKLKVVSRTYTVKAGKTAHIAIALTGPGRRVLDSFYAVPVTLSIANGAARSTRRVSFRYTVIGAPIDFFWNYRPAFTFVGNLTASKLKPSWHVALSCQGGGCPFKQTTIKIHRGAAVATTALSGAHLRPGTIVQMTISAKNAVAEVLRFTIVSNKLPRVTALCQTPDARTPGTCRG